MARYIDEILQPGEKVLYSTNAHWMFYLPAIGVWIVVAILLVASGLVMVPALMLFCWACAAVAAKRGDACARLALSGHAGHHPSGTTCPMSRSGRLTSRAHFPRTPFSKSQP